MSYLNVHMHGCFSTATDGPRSSATLRAASTPGAEASATAPVFIDSRMLPIRTYTNYGFAAYPPPAAHTSPGVAGLTLNRGCVGRGVPFAGGTPANEPLAFHRSRDDQRAEPTPPLVRLGPGGEYVRDYHGTVAPPSLLRTVWIYLLLLATVSWIVLALTLWIVHP